MSHLLRSLKVLLMHAAVAAIYILPGASLMAQEEAKYTVIKEDGKFEIREYAPRVVAETFVKGSFTEASNIAFDKLFDYISGNNSTTRKIPMTAPVTQQTTPSASGESIPMTAPVTQQEEEGRFRVTFILPESYTIDSAPTPMNPDVTLEAEAESRAAAVTYSGRWSKSNYDENLKDLQDWMTSNSLTARGNPIWLRYNPPFSLPRFRRNEIIIPIADASTTTTKKE